MKKIIYRHWIGPAEKWVNAVIKTESEERFMDDKGFYELNITYRCGYCHQYIHCEDCTLHQTHSHERPICGRGNILKSCLWLYVSEMRKEEPDFQKALGYATIIRDDILKDCPDKELAKKDSIDFSILK